MISSGSDRGRVLSGLFLCGSPITLVLLFHYFMFFTIVEIGIREISATNTFAYAYVCLLRYVSNSTDSKSNIFTKINNVNY